MDRRRLTFGLSTWSTWWAWCSRARGRRHRHPIAVHRLHLRPLGGMLVSGGGNPSLLALRRLPCLVLGARQGRARKRRASRPVNGA